MDECVLQSLLQVTNDEPTANLPLVLPIEGNSSETYCECLIRGRSQRGTLVRLLAIFESRGIKVLSCNYESSVESGAFGITLILQLEKNSDSETLLLVEKLMETKMVSSVEFAPLKGKAFANFRFPIVLLPRTRGVIVLAEALAESIQGAAELSDSALQEAGIRYGHSFAKQSFEEKILAKREDLLIQILRATGWGTGKLEENEKREITFVLKDPVIGVDSEMVGKSRFLVGMLQGMLAEALDFPLQLLHDRFDGKTNSLVLKLARSSNSN
jgi:acetolactate synthase regulatory subunit